MSQLVTNVHVAAAGHQSQWFGPGDDVPAWALEKIRHNPLLWDELPDDEPAEDGDKEAKAELESPAPTKRAPRKAPAKKAAPKTAE